MDVEAVKKEFIWGKVEPSKIVRGGLRWHSGLIIPELGRILRLSAHLHIPLVLGLMLTEHWSMHDFSALE